jgi:hypothetical protein
LLDESSAQTPNVTATAKAKSRTMMRVRGTVAPSGALPAQLRGHALLGLYDAGWPPGVLTCWGTGPASRENSGPDLLHAMQFRPVPTAEVRAGRPADRPSPNDRGCPLDTARARSLWHAGGTAGEDDVAAPGGDGSHLSPSGRPVLGDGCLVGKPRRRRGRPRVDLWVMSHLSAVPGGSIWFHHRATYPGLRLSPLVAVPRCSCPCRLVS